MPGVLKAAVTKDQYESLDEKNRLIYDEMSGFAKRLAQRMDEIIDLLKKIISADKEVS